MENEVFVVENHCVSPVHNKFYDILVFSSYDKAEKYVLSVADRIDGVLDKLPINDNDTMFSVVASQSVYIWIIKKLKIDQIF